MRISASARLRLCGNCHYAIVFVLLLMGQHFLYPRLNATPIRPFESSEVNHALYTANAAGINTAPEQHVVSRPFCG